MASTKAKSTKEAKTTKKPAKKSVKELLVPDAWIDELSTLEINDENWTCTVVIIEETSTDGTVYIEHFNESAINGNRLAVKSISKLDVMKTVVKNMSENKIGKEITPLSLLCNEIFKSVGPGFDKKIPTSMLAYLIKYIVLEYKKENKEIQQGINEMQKELEEYQQSLWFFPKSKLGTAKDTKSSKPESKSTKSVDKKGIKKGKAYTKLRRRGEEWKDVTWIDDAPIDGPQLYIVVSTFWDPYLPLELLNLNIPLSAITKLNFTESQFSMSDKSLTSYLKEVLKSLHEFERVSAPYLSSNVRCVNDRATLLENKKTNIFIFWDKIHVLKNYLPTALLFKPVMFLEFTPEHSNFEYQIKSFQQEIYKQISHFLYDVFETTKQHKKYLMEIKLIDVSDSNVCELSEMQVYNSILNSIPHEVITPSFILDAIIAQVCNQDNETGKSMSQDIEGKTSEHSFPKKQSSGDSILKLLCDLNLKYDLYNDLEKLFKDEKCCKENLTTDKSSIIKTILLYGDVIKIKTFYLEKSLAEFVTTRTNQILNIGWTKLLSHAFVQNYNDAHLIKLCNEVIKIKEMTEDDRLYYYIYLLIVYSILNQAVFPKSTNKSFRKNTSRKSSLIYSIKELCDDCLFQVTNDSNSLDSYLNNKLSYNIFCSDSIATDNLTDEIIASSLFYIEYMSCDVLFQTLQSVYSKFNNLVTKYCPFTEQIVLVLHNILQCTQEFEENWAGKLTTLVPIRDFVDYILEEEQIWLLTNTDQSNLKSFDYFNPSSFVPPWEGGSNVKTHFDDLQFISPRSLKYQAVVKEQASKKTSIAKSKNQSDKTKSGPERTSKISVRQKNIKNIHSGSVEQDNKFLKETFTFLGYDLGEPMRCQFMGCKKDKIFNDNCRITINKMKKLYGDEFETIALSICGHTLYYNCKSYNQQNTSFHVILSSGIVLYFGLSKLKAESTSNIFTIYDKNSSITTNLTQETRDSKQYQYTNSPNKSSSDLKHNIKEASFSNIYSTCNLKMSTPSGLHIELKNENSLLYMRQELLSTGPLSDKIPLEKFRCYMTCGHIIKFMKNDEIEILGANGIIYNIYEIKDEFQRENNKTSSASENIIGNEKKTHQKYKVEELGKLPKNKSEKHQKKSTEFHKQSHPDLMSSQVEHGALPKQEESEQNISSDFYYKVATSDGKQYTVKNILTTQLDNLLMITSIDIGNNCLRSERLDGVSTTHSADGSLLVVFPDGSQITSTPFETDEFFCEWTRDELICWFDEYSPEDPTDSKLDLTSSSVKESIMKRGNLINEINKDFTDKLIQDNCTLDKSANFSTTITKSFIKDYGDIDSLCSSCIQSLLKDYKPKYSEDGFVVYNVNYLMEHPVYCTVYYNAKSSEIECKLPFCTGITLSRDGCYASFEGATLKTDSDSIQFSKVNETGSITRSMIVSICEPTKVQTSIYSDILGFKTRSYVIRKSLQCNKNEFGFWFSMKQMFHGFGWVLLYSFDGIGNEIFVDHNLNFHELLLTTEFNDDKVNDFYCFVINKDFSGFRLVSDEEVVKHVKKVTENNDLLRKSNDIWSTIFTSSAVMQNESEKWLMKYSEKPIQPTISTFKNQAPWIHPFVNKERTEHQLTIYDAVVVRYLHRVPTDETILHNLSMALDNFKKGNPIEHPIKNIHEPKKGHLHLNEMVQNPSILRQIYTEENIKINKDRDVLRTNMNKICVQTLINQACLKARKQRQKNKEEELKAVLRNKEIPQYHLSCFGQVHDVLNELMDNIDALHKPSSRTSICERVNSIIDEILSLVRKSKSINSTNESLNTQNNYRRNKEITEIDNVLNEIVEQVLKLTEDRSHQQLVNAILEKSLNLITSQDIDFLNEIFATGSGDCPIYNEEEFMIQDILAARYQLSHYFRNLREMLEFYRGSSNQPYV